MNAPPNSAAAEHRHDGGLPPGNKLARIAWAIAGALLFRWSPRPLFGWRATVLRCFGARVGRAVRIYPRARIWAPWNLEIGDHACVADDATVYNQGRAVIGEWAVVSQGAYLCGGTHDFEDPAFVLVTRPVVIGAHAWIAAQAFVHPGVTVNEGCVVGARSVVTRDLPEWTVCSGFPATVLRERKRTGRSA